LVELFFWHIFSVQIGRARIVGKGTGLGEIWFGQVGIIGCVWLRGCRVVRTGCRNCRVVRTIVSAAAVVGRPRAGIRNRTGRVSGARVSSVGWTISRVTRTRGSSRVYSVVGDINIVVVPDRTAATPVPIPIEAPVVVAIVDKRPKQNPGPERQDSGEEQITTAVSRGRLDRRAVSTGGIVLWDVNRIRLGRLNDDRLLYRRLCPALSGRRNRFDFNVLLRC
jgi:hypothetical protein